MTLLAWTGPFRLLIAPRRPGSAPRVLPLGGPGGGATFSIRPRAHARLPLPERAGVADLGFGLAVLLGSVDPVAAPTPLTALTVPARLDIP